MKIGRNIEQYCAEHNTLIIEDECRYCAHALELKEIDDIIRRTELKDRNLQRTNEWRTKFELIQSNKKLAEKNNAKESQKDIN